MIYNFDIRIKYACPVCGHYYYESDFGSGYSFCDYSTTYTDGYNDHSHSGFHQCLRCGSIFHEKYINILSLSNEEEKTITSREYRNEYYKRTGCPWYGHIDGDYFGSPQSTEMFSKRWWRSCDKPLYFPDSVSESEKQKMTDIFNTFIWRTAHYRHTSWIRESALSMEKYKQVRKNILASVYYYEPDVCNIEFKADCIKLDLLLVKIELLRNMCHFDECLTVAYEIWNKCEKHIKYYGYTTRFNEIINAAHRQISQTLQLPKSRWQ